MTDCLFCKIIAGDIPSAKVYEDEFCYAFRDIAPQTPVHVLLVPKAHVSSIVEAATLPKEAQLALIRAISIITRQEGIADGLRVVSNCGENACQSVHHLHFHLMGGTKMVDKMA